MISHLINSRSYTTIGSIKEESILDSKKNYLFDLSYLSVLALYGDKTRDFLQGQLTADINKVNDIQMAQAAQCNLKGRILSLMDVVNWNGLKLIMPNDLLEKTQHSLNKTAQLSRVTIQEETQYAVWGFYLQNADDLIPNSVYLPPDLYSKAESTSFCYYHLGDGFYIFIIEKNNESQLIEPFKTKKQILGSLSWHSLRLKRGELSIYPESRGEFLPHRLDLHKTPYLSFDKGCYKGQEIIARTHYKATLKHHLGIYLIKTEATLFSGQKFFNIDEPIELGELVDFSPLGENQYAVAISLLKNAPLEGRLENTDSVLSLAPFN